MTDFLARTDAVIAARGTSRSAVGQKAGYSKGLIQNWDRFEQSPSLKRLAKVAEELKVDPAWLAYSSVPQPVPPPNGFVARPEKLDQSDTYLGVAYSAYQADDGRLESRFFDALEMLGLHDAIYILRQVDGELVYDHIGPLFRRTLGWSWWIEAPGKRVIDDPDQSFAGWTLAHFQEAMHSQDPAAHDCLVVSRYTSIPKGWRYKRLILPFGDLMIVIVQVLNDG